MRVVHVGAGVGESDRWVVGVGELSDQVGQPLDIEPGHVDRNERTSLAPEGFVLGSG